MDPGVSTPGSVTTASQASTEERTHAACLRAKGLAAPVRQGRKEDSLSPVRGDLVTLSF